MDPHTGHDFSEFQGLTVGQLRQRYAEVFGEATHAGHKGWLVKRIAWRLQALAEGGLSERARQRAAELANEADLRLSPPRPGSPVPVPPCPASSDARDRRLPPPGTILTRRYQGQTLQVRILPTGFEFAGRTFTSLSAVAQAATGSHCSGYAFFRLHHPRAKRP